MSFVFIFFRICSSHNSSAILSKIVSVAYISVYVETLLPERDLAAFGIVVFNVGLYSQSACVLLDIIHQAVIV